MPPRLRTSKRTSSRRRAKTLIAAAVVSLLPAAFVPSIAFAAPAAGVSSDIAPFDAVDQFIGTELDTTQDKSNDAYGNTYPGATLPFGMVQPSPTTYSVGETNGLVREKGGYEYTADQLRGFGMTRYSGTGCHERFGGYEFPTIPYTGDFAEDGTLPRNPAGDHRSYFLNFSHDDEVSEPGYYAVTTADGTTSELTATKRTAVSRFDFSQADGSTLILDASGANNRTFEVDIAIDPDTRTVSGSMYGADVCDNGNSYRAYFSTTYDQDFTGFGTWDASGMTAASVEASVAGGTDSDQRHQVGGWVTFADDTVVTAKTGFSYTSIEAAAANAVAETEGASFDDVRADARAVWEEALGTVDAQGGTEEQRVKLYTALYHSLLQPTIGHDADGRYLGFDGQMHEVEEGRDFFRRINFAGQGWDMYRSQAQLIAMLFPNVANDINHSIVLLTQQTGKWSPGAARMSGDNYQVILSTLDAFGATDYDRQAALDSMLETQQLPGTESTRSNAYQYFATGIIENGKGDFATSRVLEYAIDDFAIAQLAERLGHDEAYDRMMVRAQNWLNVFDSDDEHIRPRSRNGFDTGFDLRTRGNQFNQSTGYQYGWMVPHNIGALVEKRGGIEKSMDALDILMEDLDAGTYTQTGNYLSNEAALTTPWVYHWLEAPHKTTDVLYRAVEEMYDTTPSGLPGNDDEGALSSWYVFANLGIAPMIHGTANMLVTAPMFDRITLNSVGSDRVYDIVAPGVSDGQKYTAALTVNGQAQDASWVGEDFARDGGTLEFTMSFEPGAWGTSPEDVPPSYTDGMDARNNVGTTPNGQGNLGSMDLSDWSFSRQDLANAGAAPGQTIPYENTDLEFTWPDTQPGEPDNWIPHGQRIDLGGVTAGSISFLGLATNGPSVGTAHVEYTDGSMQPVRVSLADWGQSPADGGATLVTVGSRNHFNGTSAGGTFRVFGTQPAILDTEKKVAAVHLPGRTDRGIMHIFDVATSESVWDDPNAPSGDPHRIVLTTTADPATSQYVTWRSHSQSAVKGTAEIRPVGGGDTVAVDAVEAPERSLNGYPARNHTARFDDLTPNTAYEYRVGSGEKWSDWYEFTTASAEPDPFTFLYFGDAQEGLDSVWHQTMNAATTAHPDAELGLFSGDLVNTSSNDSEWTDWFEGVKGFAEHANVIAGTGNHEYWGDPFTDGFRDSFTYDGNGPVPSDAGEYEEEFGDLISRLMKDTTYYTDYQGVRFVTLSATIDDICPAITSEGATDCDAGRRAWMTAQATWLDRVLRGNPHEWSIVQAHQPVMGASLQGNGPELRDEWEWRRYIMPVMERNNVDLVLQGHDHSYGRGHHLSTATDLEGVSAGPVYVVANAGEKMYTVSPPDDNIWTRNGAELVRQAQDTATYSAIRVDGDTLTYEAVATYTRPGGAAPIEVGETLDSFTITKRDDGAKWVTEDGVSVPDASVAPVNTTFPSNTPFDSDTFGEVVFDDDFSTDRLDEYEVFGDVREPLADVSVDTGSGVLRADADGRRWSHIAIPEAAGESFALIVEPDSFAGTGAAEDSLFLGMTDGADNRAHSWFNNSQSQSAMNVVVDGTARAVAEGAISARSVSWEPGDRFAIVLDRGELTSWIEKEGSWEPIRSSYLPLAMTDEQVESWQPTFSVRQDAGTIDLGRVTLLRPAAEAELIEVTPAAVEFVDLAGTADDTYTIPAVDGVEYLVDGVVVNAGTYPGVGEVTVTAEALDGHVIAEGAQTIWSFTFTDVADPTDPTEPGDPGEPGEPTDPADPGEPADPTDPDDSGEAGGRTAPAVDDLTDATRNGLTVAGDMRPGGLITVTMQGAAAGDVVEGWVFSQPVSLGTSTVNGEGSGMFTLPRDIAAGAHRLAVTAADGTLIGWTEIEIVDEGTSEAGAELPPTGLEMSLYSSAGVVALLLVAFGALVLIWRRRMV